MTDCAVVVGQRARNVVISSSQCHHSHVPCSKLSIKLPIHYSQAESNGDFVHSVSRQQRRTWRFGGAPIPRALVYDAFHARSGTQHTSDSAFCIETTRVLKGCVLEVLQRL